MASATPTPNHTTPQRHHALSSAAAQGSSPPNKRDLKSWWKGFKLAPRQQPHTHHHHQQEPQEPAPLPTKGIFGVPLRQSITYANVAISLVDENGQSYIYGYVPIVVAKCGVFLKEKATGIEGIFRLSGSEKRIKELKQVFDSPDRYGKGLVWDGYTVHDAAVVFRRYLNDLPEPVVPLDLYEKFRDPLRGATRQAVGDADGPQFVENFDEKGAITKYQKLITELPPLNRQLLLYILDLLAVFAAKSDENRMNSQNLAAIFQPGMLSHPSHAMAPAEYRLNQCVIIFLIENQDHFLIGMQGTAADEETKKEVEAGTPVTAVTPTSKRSSGLGRSASNASAGAESVRRDGKLRRNRSVSSKHSNSRHGDTGTPNSPALTATPTGGLGRSNTVPSKKSPALRGDKFRRTDASAQHSSPALEPLTQARPVEELEKTPEEPAEVQKPVVSSAGASGVARAQLDVPRAPTPSRERKVSNLFQRGSSAEHGEKKAPNKLKKKRMPDSLNPSAHSSSASLGHIHSNVVSPNAEEPNPMEVTSFPKLELKAEPKIGQDTEEKLEEQTPDSRQDQDTPTPRASSQTPTRDTITVTEAQKSDAPAESVPSTVVDKEGESIVGGDQRVAESQGSEKEGADQGLSSTKTESTAATAPSTQHAIQPVAAAAASHTSVDTGSSRPRKSFTAESSEQGAASVDHDMKEGSDSRDESKGPMNWIKNKMREARTKSPPGDKEKHNSSSFLGTRHNETKTEEKEPQATAVASDATSTPQAS